MVEGDTRIVAEVRDSIESEFISVRFIDVEGIRVRRLLFDTEFADQFPVFVVPKFGPGYDLQTGTRYRLSNVLICHTDEKENQDGDWTKTADFDGQFNQISPAIDRAVQNLNLGGRFGVCDQKTTMELL